MAISYKLHQDNRINSVNKGKWYARATMTDEIRLKGISERIQRNCSMKQSDVNAVLTELVEVMKDELQASHRVVIDGLGSFRIGLKTIPADSAKEFSAVKNIVGARVNFMPTVEVNRLTNKRVKRLLEGFTVKEYGAYNVDKGDGDDTPEP